MRAEDLAAEIRELKKQVGPLTARIKQLEAEVAKQKRERKEAKEAKQPVQAAAVQPVPEAACQQAPCPPPAPLSSPVSVNFNGRWFGDRVNGPIIETADRDFVFRFGGRIFLDGGISGQPEKGYGSQADVTQARMSIDGHVWKFWDFKLEYDFAGSAPLTSLSGTSTSPVGGIRDAFIAATYFDPVVFQVGNFYEPFSLERTQTKTSVEFIERAMPVDALTPSRHIGLAAFTMGPNWSIKAGVFTTSVEDKALTPLAGGNQYWDAAGRLTFDPIRGPDTLLHVGASIRYERPNDATAGGDNRVLQPGTNVDTEADVLNENLLGTQPLDCGATVLGESCAKNVLDYGFEGAAVYGPLSIQGEYMGADYNRDATLIEYLKAPGAASLNFSGYYAFASWFLTGESRETTYRMDYRRPGTFGQLEPLSPVSEGGLGAWELAARLSELNLNSGGVLVYQGRNVPSNIQGGRETDFTLGLNWYPQIGIRFMADWVKVLQLAAPYNAPTYNGIHPNIFVMRAQVNW
ncbi:MAG TPA: porin [Methylocella sp.]|nr:porin [Methylocella sp.]